MTQHDGVYMLDGRIAVFGEHDAGTLTQLRDVASRATYAALMADGHLGYVMPIGGVAAYRQKVSVTGVGFDIACGNCAIRTNRNIVEYTREELELLADEIQRMIAFGVGAVNRNADAPVDNPLFESAAWDLLPGLGASKQNLIDKARSQLGTAGSGNHYVDILSDEKGTVWVGVHFGSRGFGHNTASGFLALSQNKQWGAHVPETEALLDIKAPLGADYWSLMNLAGEYAYAGREWAARKAVEIIGGTEMEMVHNHHNFAWIETHAGQPLVVVRKGATPAFPGQKGFVGGSMGDNAVILEGANVAGGMFGGADAATAIAQRLALFSTVHGAGRVMSRTQARGKINRKTGEIIKPGAVTQEMLNDWLGPRGVVLRGGGLDEAPQAYRRLPEVLRAQGDTVRVLHILTPVIVVMDS